MLIHFWLFVIEEHMFLVDQTSVEDSCQKKPGHAAMILCMGFSTNIIDFVSPWLMGIDMEVIQNSLFPTAAISDIPFPANMADLCKFLFF